MNEQCEICELESIVELTDRQGQFVTLVFVPLQEFLYGCLALDQTNLWHGSLPTSQSVPGLQIPGKTLHDGRLARVV